jgi:hypothetical protein
MRWLAIRWKALSVAVAAMSVVTGSSARAVTPKKATRWLAASAEAGSGLRAKKRTVETSTRAAAAMTPPMMSVRRCSRGFGFGAVETIGAPRVAAAALISSGSPLTSVARRSARRARRSSVLLKASNQLRLASS